MAKGKRKYSSRCPLCGMSIRSGCGSRVKGKLYHKVCAKKVRSANKAWAKYGR